jgi:GNAT superfamily N-acetyltransferase
VGDAPVVYARWRLEALGESQVAVIDRLEVLKNYRGRGFSRRSMDFIVQVRTWAGQESALSRYLF